MRLSRNTKIAYGLTALAFGIGFFIALMTGDWSWFARSGSVVVVIGIVFTSNQIFEHQRRLKESRASLEARSRREKRATAGEAHHANRDWAGGDGLRALARARTREEDTWEIEGHGFYMLVSGTLVWGFGDLLGGLPLC